MLADDAFTRLFEALEEGVYIGLVGRDETATLAANQHLRQIFGWPPEAPDALVRPLAPDRFVDDLARDEYLADLRREGAVPARLLRLRRVDETAIWVEVTARAEPLPGGDTLRVDALMRDVTERRKRDDQARDLQMQLAQAEKLAALGQTMSGVAHELNNPLATILACAERLTGEALDPATRRDLDAIHNAAERAARIVRNLQTFARKRHTTRTTVDLNQVVRDTLALHAFTDRPRSVVVEESLAGSLPSVFVDPHQIQQILLNLIVNAEQAITGGGRSGTLAVRSRDDGERDAVVIEVQDDGPGIPLDIQPRIFDPFFTTKPVGRGTGLGLTVAYAIAAEHGGELRFASEPGQGTCFTLALPATGARVRAPEPPATGSALVAPRGTRALIVEDEVALGDAVAAALGDAGFRVDRAADGAEGLARVRAQHYDVIVCDLKMPRVDGRTFFRTIAPRVPGIARRLIFMTGDVAGTEAEEFLRESGCKWIPKPFRLRDLVRVAVEAAS
ncbi:MAG TPA: ATP-binding protein [Vicinamibacterales bacterium]|nr:ATP-binding protein [Vicinamibacterales bacterium]